MPKTNPPFELGADRVRVDRLTAIHRGDDPPQPDPAIGSDLQLAHHRQE